MTEKEYLDRNAKGYEGDTFIHTEIAKLVKLFNVTSIIETGTYKGGTTKRLLEFCPVTSIESDLNNYNESRRNLNGFITLIHGDSSKVLKDHTPIYPNPEKVLLFLDAHWADNWPLLAELRQISELEIKPVIVIHDFKVPGKDFGYDSYAGQELDFNYIEGSLRYIYGEDGYSYHYNEQADGGYRGVIYIYPKI